MRWILILHFTCGYGCGTPALVELPERYATWAQCEAAGRVWLSPNANPMHTVARFSCMGGRIRGRE